MIGVSPNAGAQPLEVPEHFLLERIAAANARRRNPIATGSTSGNNDKRRCNPVGVKPQQPTGIEIDGPAHEVPPQRPAFDAAAGDVTRADHHVHRRPAGRVHAGQQGRQIARVVAEIGVHVQHLT